MVVRRRFVLETLLLAGVFGSGFVAAGWSRTLAKDQARAKAPAAGAAVSQDSACVDRGAMEANANLVEQIGDYRRRYESARDHAEAASQTADEIAKAPPA